MKTYLSFRRIKAIVRRYVRNDRYWRQPDGVPIPNADAEKYAEYICQHYESSLKDYNKKYGGISTNIFTKLLKENEQIKKDLEIRLKELEPYVSDTRKMLEEQIQQYRESTKNQWDKERKFEETIFNLRESNQKTSERFEQEVIHLKELVQEKNMVIDKLLAEVKTREVKKETEN